VVLQKKVPRQGMCTCVCSCVCTLCVCVSVCTLVCTYVCSLVCVLVCVLFCVIVYPYLGRALPIPAIAMFSPYVTQGQHKVWDAPAESSQQFQISPSHIRWTPGPRPDSRPRARPRRHRGLCQGPPFGSPRCPLLPPNFCACCSCSCCCCCCCCCCWRSCISCCAPCSCRSISWLRALCWAEEPGRGPWCASWGASLQAVAPSDWKGGWGAVKGSGRGDGRPWAAPMQALTLPLLRPIWFPRAPAPHLPPSAPQRPAPAAVRTGCVTGRGARPPGLKALRRVRGGGGKALCFRVWCTRGIRRGASPGWLGPGWSAQVPGAKGAEGRARGSAPASSSGMGRSEEGLYTKLSGELREAVGARGRGRGLLVRGRSLRRVGHGVRARGGTPRPLWGHSTLRAAGGPCARQDRALTRARESPGGKGRSLRRWSRLGGTREGLWRWQGGWEGHAETGRGS